MPARTETKWDKQWSNWEEPAWPAYTQLRLDYFKNTCRKLADTLGWARPRIVELGAGIGWSTRAVLEVFPEAPYLCADVSREALDKLALKECPNVSSCLMGELAEQTQKADLVICGDVYEHVEDRQAFIRQIKDVLKPGGRLLLTTPNRYMPILYFRRMLKKEATGQPFDRPVDRKQLEKAFSKAGFNIIECCLAKADEKAPIATSTSKRMMLSLILGMVACGLWMAQKPTDHAIFMHAERME